ncbi:MAG: 4-alpha-glucanotransferase [Melioribacteraceae bacterium]|nr:4-alpha-glucanotransferase [Melioribacteraceae bacterium]
MKIQRSAGVLLHPTSLPGKFGIGDLGPNAYKFIDFLQSAGQNLWQVFPLGPTGYGDSPYQCFSAFAGNPLLISPELLHSNGFLSDDDLNGFPEFNPYQIDFGALIPVKNQLLRNAYSNFIAQDNKIELVASDFINANKFWLDDFALFMAAKQYHGGILWTQWDQSIAFRKNIDEWKAKLKDEIDYQIFLQFTFISQWNNLKNYVHSKGIKIIGDLPIFIAYDSADLWANKKFFTVNEDGSLKFVAGVPPDYFSATGQLWGNPLYKWKEMEKDNFGWWKARVKQLLQFVDIVRIDHFRGLDAYWEIAGNATTAINGRWVKAPGEKLFYELKKEFGDLPIIAEDLGVITDSVTELREKFDLPGIKILQFGLGENGDRKFLPHNHVKNCVLHTGSHDNETTKGFLESERSKNSGIYEWAQNYFNYYGDDLTFHLIKSAYSSVANIVVIPMQDILNLGNEARMNFPGRLGGNWNWRFTWDQINNGIIDTYKNLSIIYERPPTKIDDPVIINIEEE